MSVLFATALGLALLAAAGTLVAPRSARSAVSGIGTALAGVAGTAAGVLAIGTAPGGTTPGGTTLNGASWSLDLPGLFPLVGIRLELDALGGVFLAVAGGVSIVAGLYAVGYSRGAARTAQAVLPLFAASLLAVPAAGGVTTFLLFWELMAVTSLVALLTEHRRRGQVASAARWYAIMTHLGFVAILVGLLVLAAHAGDSFTEIRTAGFGGGLADLVFVLTLAGFASKAGIVPLHAWLPRAHPEAPSHVSALMSASMVTMGVYGVIRVGIDLLGGGPHWWWLLVLGLGAASALYGILQAVVSADLKRLLGNSTTENMGLVLIGVGASGVFAASGSGVLAGLALTAALLHVVVHAAFKTVLFLAAGSVLHATGTRDLDALGGLRPAMPVTALAFGIGALSASALPPGPAFLSEWLLLQSLVHGLTSAGVATAIAMPLAVGTVALTAGLAVATFVKAFGVGFLARPRSAEAAAAHESPWSMRGGMVLAALACAVLALAPALVLPALGRVGAALSGPGTAPAVDAGPLLVELEGFTGSLSPVLVTSALLAGIVGVAAVTRLIVGRRQRRTAVRLWDCGLAPPTEHMEYTATSFAEPLQRVFDDVVRPEHDLDVSHAAESNYLVESIDYRLRVPDRIEHRLYDPVLTAVRGWAKAAPVLANGSVHRYLGYGFATVCLALIALVVIA